MHNSSHKLLKWRNVQKDIYVKIIANPVCATLVKALWYADRTQMKIVFNGKLTLFEMQMDKSSKIVLHWNKKKHAWNLFWKP